MAQLLEITHVSKVYRLDRVVFKALVDISFRLKQGEYVAIMGPSGSGKSTLMHIIGCLDKPTKGRIILEGLDVSDASEKELAKIRNEKIGFVFQQFNLLQRTSALANVELPLIYRADSTKLRREKALKQLIDVGLEEKIANFPSQLSGGQQQRVAIARALVTDPSIILADEPTGNLDSKSGEEILAIFDRLNKAGRTIVVITHEHDIANYAKRKIQLMDGKIISDRKR